MMTGNVSALGEAILSLSRTQHTMLVIFLAVMIKGVLLVKYEQWKTAQEAKPIPMTLKRGVYVPDGPVQKVERLATRFMYAWLVWMAVLIVALFAGFRIQ